MYTQTRKQPYTLPMTATEAGSGIYEVFQYNGGKKRVGFAAGKQEDITAFYAARHPGRIELSEIHVQEVSPQMAANAVTSNVVNILRGATIDERVRTC